MLPSKNPLLILAALLGGCGLVGMIVMVVNLYIGFASGFTSGIWLTLGVFIFGAAGGLGTVWLVMRRFERDVLKRLGLDK